MANKTIEGLKREVLEAQQKLWNAIDQHDALKADLVKNEAAAANVKQSDQPADKPADKPAAQPAAQPADKPAAQPAAQPADAKK